MARGDFKTYLVYLVVNNWKWLKWVLLLILGVLVYRAI